MARPRKMGISYFPLDTDFFDNDSRIKVLRAKYRSDGIIVYIFLLCEIYKQGYYIQVDDDLEFIISAELGMSSEKVKQVLNFLLKKSLFDNKLFSTDKVLTSAGIQKRFQLAVKERARKNPIEVGRYWLLNEQDTEPFIKCTLFSDRPRKNGSYSRKNNCNSTEESLKKSKVNNTINICSFDDPELQQSFQLYLMVRENNWGPISEEQIQALKDDLLQMASDKAERIAILKKATAGGWKSLYPVKKKSPVKGKGSSNDKKKQGFHKINQREYDFDSLESKLLDNR